MKVKNIKATDDKSPKKADWLEHWKHFSGKNLPEVCQVKSCANKPETGGLVLKNSYTDRQPYVLPVCGFHNDQKGETLRVKNSVNLVSVYAGAARPIPEN